MKQLFSLIAILILTLLGKFLLPLNRLKVVNLFGGFIFFIALMFFSHSITLVYLLMHWGLFLDSLAELPCGNITIEKE